MSGSTSPVILFTGFPGFLASELVPRVLSRANAADAVCLVQPHHAALAATRAAAIMAARPSLAGRITIIEGDITLPMLGRADARLDARVVEIFHLAAVYDLALPQALGLRVNVEGTRNVLDLARRCPRLERLQYVSTCYVSGRYPGVFTEGMLQEARAFNNFYEETKQLAEVAVRGAMGDGLPVTIYRPSIVVGDSVTGATQKFDGPYFALQWMLRQPRRAVMPVFGDPAAVEFNVVPRDYVVDAMAYLSARPETLGGVYQLADPRPLTVDALLEELGRVTGRRVLRLRLAPALARGALRYLPGLEGWMGIPAASVDYFCHPTRYGTEATREALSGSGIHCPAFPEYSSRLVDYMRAHPEIGSAAMI